MKRTLIALASLALAALPKVSFAQCTSTLQPYFDFAQHNPSLGVSFDFSRMSQNGFIQVGYEGWGNTAGHLFYDAATDTLKTTIGSPGWLLSGDEWTNACTTLGQRYDVLQHHIIDVTITRTGHTNVSIDGGGIIPISSPTCSNGILYGWGGILKDSYFVFTFYNWIPIN